MLIENESMKRYGLLVLSLGMVCFWLIGSYLPQSKPIISLSLPLPDSFLDGMVIFCFAAFLAIQIWILFSTKKALSSKSRPHQLNVKIADGNLNSRVELFWTFLPIVLTLLLAWSSWMFWQVR